MRMISLIVFFGLSIGLLQACTSPTGTQIAGLDGAYANCDEYEGYPDCYPDHPLDQ